MDGQSVYPEHTLELSADIIIVGAGVAGATAAAVLHRQGWRVKLVDAQATCPPVFKAEKVEGEGLRLLRELGLFTPLLPFSGRIEEVCVAYNGHIFKKQDREQIGISYSDLVNTLRANLPAEIETKLGRVDQITRDRSKTTVYLDNGEKLTARLAVLSCGVNKQLLSSLGLRLELIQKDQSSVAGFNIATTGSRAFDFDSLTSYATDPAFRIGYLNFFKVPDGMRANLFAYHAPNSPLMREVYQNPKAFLDRAFPKLPRIIGEYDVVGKVVTSCVDLYRTEGEMPDGVVLIGDAFQNSCPVTGCGYSKVFTDVNVLAECVPAWFSTPGMGADKLRRFYDDPRKRTEDATALRRAVDERLEAVSMEPRWRLRRAVLHVRRHLTRTKPRQARVPQHQESARAAA
jgi:2-polyprenyl-6-methoxyphenol hydroxylase-like FAD-dependent oxidoreductase